MKIKVLLIAFFFCIAVAVAADVTFDGFTARSDGKSVVLEWQTSVEHGIVRYEIERTSSSDQPYRMVAAVEARNSGAYRFIDEDAFMKQQAGTPEITQGRYTYRIKAVSADNSALYSNSANVTHSVSGIRRTWGMIKEMFR